MANNTDKSSGVSIIDMSLTAHHSKAKKLITALYMVTDIIDIDEPIRIKLRTLGVEIISDINANQTRVGGKINEVMSFLDIATAMNFISTMNHSILKKEFTNLHKLIQNQSEIKPTWLSEFLLPENDLPEIEAENEAKESIGQTKFFQQPTPTRIGVQKGSTLMQALSDKTRQMSNIKTNEKDNFDLIKLQRRNDIINILRLIDGNGTIKDIKDKIKTFPEKAGDLAKCSEKTLQRELVSMTKDGVLHKTGEKRWSRYFIKTS